MMMYQRMWTIWSLIHLLFTGRNQTFDTGVPYCLADIPSKSPFYVCFSEADRDFMLKHIQGYLEEELGFKLCIHERDFMPGTSIIGNIEEAVKHSRRTIVLISKQVFSFFGVWCDKNSAQLPKRG